jgi:glycosyltransferase involved in cell wall biosynthesis
MKVLWLSPNSSLYLQDKDNRPYHGGEWIASAQRLLEDEQAVELGVCFISNQNISKSQDGRTTYYPIFSGRESAIQKLRKYYGGYKHYSERKFLEPIQNVIRDFKPDVIHLWGVENPLSVILGHTDIPVVTHIQGLLLPFANAFYPEGFNRYSFLLNGFSKNEWLLRNGYVFAEKSIRVRSRLEVGKLKAQKFIMGRTNWDRLITNFYAPGAHYFHVDEVMRDIFYQGFQPNRRNGKLQIVSTLSLTVYKGLDVILKTAKLLCDETNLDFEWCVIGIPPSSPFVNFFEKALGIVSSEVHVHYMGSLNSEKLYALLQKSNIYVHPSYIDNSPNSICEAQLIGRPVVACQVGGIDSLVNHGEDGYLVPANAPFEMAYYLKKIAFDDYLLQAFSKKAFDMASKRHDKKKIKEDILKVYYEVIRLSTR